MPSTSVGSHCRPETDAESTGVWEGPLLTITWFGFLTGWLELGLILSRLALVPQVSDTMVRINRHFIWMVPVSNVLIFAAIGLLIVPLAWILPKFTRWFTLRLPIALGTLALVLLIEGIYAISAIILACGIASVSGRWFQNRPRVFRQVIRVSFPVMAVGLVVLTGLTYARVTSAERRALSRLPLAKPGAPNVLLIVLDNVRASSLSLYGHNRPTSPNLERLARKGAVFSEASSTAPWTLPTHASMLTGRWPHELSVGWDRPLDDTYPTLAEILGQKGYATAGFVGNTYYCNAAFGLGRGFARYEDAYENLTISLFETIRSSGLGRHLIKTLGYPAGGNDWLTSVRKTAEMINRDALNWLVQRPSAQPFFLFLNYYDAHTPFLPPDGPDPRFGLAALSLEEKLEIDRRFAAWSVKKTTTADSVPENVEAEAIEMYRDSYESSIAYLDRQVGLLMDEIERRGLLDNTLVILTSDHGEHFGEHSLLGHGLSLYRDEVHVPLLIIPPSRSQSPISSSAKIVHDPVSLREIPATVAACVESNPRMPFPGRSLARFLSDDVKQVPETSPVLCEVQHLKRFPRTDQIPSTLGPVSSLMTRKRVYIRGGGGREEYYDIANDPIESDNLAGVPEFRLEMDRFRQELGQLSRSVPTQATK
ncbi:sulfatase [Singulisphaera sp. Ch08]|uniref:Sulfatase n=1 Tax=Singulisphaera sp. Ch08 TaxID=3120278 RepID=A0AAU7CRK3_9BACT